MVVSASFVYPVRVADRFWGAVAQCTSQHHGELSYHIIITSLGKDQNSKFDVWFVGICIALAPFLKIKKL